MKKIVIGSCVLSALISTASFASIDGTYGELAIGSSAVGVSVGNASDSSNSTFLLRGGAGYRAHFSKTTPLFWGVDTHINNYGGDGFTGDAALMLGGDLSKYLALYVKAGGEYSFNDTTYSKDNLDFDITGNKSHFKAGVGINYRISKCAALALELNGTDLAHATSSNGSEINFVRADVSLGLQYKF